MTARSGEHDVDVMDARKLLEGAETIARRADELRELLARDDLDRDAIRGAGRKLRAAIEDASSAMRRPGHD